MILAEVAINEISFENKPSESLVRAEFAEGLKAIFSHSRSLSVLNIDALFMPTDRNRSCYDAILDHLNRDEKEQFLLHLSRCPSGWTSSENWAGRAAVEAKIDGRTSSGAAMAVTRRSGLAGLGTTTLLRSAVLDAQVYEMDSSTGEIRERSATMQHWYDAATALDFHARRSIELQELVDDPEDIWRYRSDIYPRLRFLAPCRDQLCAIESVAFRQVAHRLRELNDAANAWRVGTAAPEWKSKITPEYEGREKLCHFPDDAGNVHLYEMHARFTPGAGRIHFRLLHQERMIEIAYIGRKLGS